MNEKLIVNKRNELANMRMKIDRIRRDLIEMNEDLNYAIAEYQFTSAALGMTETLIIPASYPERVGA